MIGRTHDLAALTSLVLVVSVNRPLTISLSTLLLGLVANQIGGIIPDIDQPTAPFWRNLPIGNLFGKVFSKVSGGHRFITHSLLGVVLFGLAVRALLTFLSPLLGSTNLGYVWWSFMIGMVSHLIMDSLTKEGVPLLLPFSWHFGLPPLKAFRITTGKKVEQFIVFPGLLVLCALLFIANRSYIIQLLHTTK